MNTNQTNGAGLEANGPESTTNNAQNVIDLSPVVNQEPVHLEGWNYLFCDGHVKWYRPESTIDTNSSDSFTGTLTSPRGFWTLSETD